MQPAGRAAPAERVRARAGGRAAAAAGNGSSGAAASRASSQRSPAAEGQNGNLGAERRAGMRGIAGMGMVRRGWRWVGMEWVGME